MTNNTERTRVRYGRLEDRTPKNTLVTYRCNDVVYFGIARCNRKLDTFHRNIGSYIAEQRALLAREDCQTDRYENLDNTNIRLHESGLRGSVELSNIKQLVEYFKQVDSYCLDCLTPRTVRI